MIVRRLELEEVPLLVEGGFLFAQEGKLPGGFNGAHFVRQWQRYIMTGQGRVFAGFDDAGVIQGALGAVKFNSPYNNKLFTVEQFWYMLPESRGRGLQLLEAFEAWSAEVKAEFMCMIHLLELQPEILGKLYRRRGYRPIEVNYLKALPCQ